MRKNWKRILLGTADDVMVHFFKHKIKAMEFTGNHMIDGDNGASPASPYHNQTFRHKCEWCGGGCNSRHEVEYVLPRDNEESPSRFMQVCDSCNYDLKNNPQIILL